MGRRNCRNISNRWVQSLRVRKETVFWDRRLVGFGVRAYPSGARVYIVQARGPEGSRRVTIGRHGIVSAEEARKRAVVAIGRIVAGEDPQPQRTRAAGITVAAAARRYMREYVTVRCKPRTIEMREFLIRRHILPALGSRPMRRVERQDVVDLHHGMASIPVQANHVLATLSQIFSYAEDRALVPTGTNPCKGVRQYRLQRRERFLTESEFIRIGRVLDQALEIGGASPAAVAAIRLLMLTGCRKNEILSLRWADVNLPSRELRLRDTKTGPRMVPLSPSAVKVLCSLADTAKNEWVIPGRRFGKRMYKLGNTWRLLRERADLRDVRLHDLRHSFASRALALGETLPMIAKLLGHRRLESTSRYAHLERGAVHDAAERVAVSLAQDIV